MQVGAGVAVSWDVALIFASVADAPAHARKRQSFPFCVPSLSYGEAELAQLLDSETLRKYERLQAMRLDPSLRECPQCHGLVAGAKGKQQRSLACSSCGTAFCLRHSLSHSPQVRAYGCGSDPTM